MGTVPTILIINFGIGLLVSGLVHWYDYHLWDKEKGGFTLSFERVVMMVILWPFALYYAYQKKK